MEPNEVIDVRVVETVHNYTETVKLAALAGVVTVLATGITTYALNSLAAKIQKKTAESKERQDEMKNR